MIFQMLYPEERKIEDRHLMGWAQDHCADNEMQAPTDVYNAISILEDAGLVTIGNHGKPL